MKIAIIGYGKMGKQVEKIALERGHEIVTIIDHNNLNEFDSDKFKTADVAIEFTNPEAAYENYIKAFKAGVKIVSGSTGWMDQHGDEIKNLCKDGANTLFWASNFSLGVAIFSSVNKFLAKIMNDFPAYEVSMSETHHIHKLDAPSGTAITLAEGLLANIDRKNDWVNAPSSDEHKLYIESIREGEVPGIHSIKYTSDADTITITHDAKNRLGFALGAVLAAEFTAKNSGFLGMSDLFSFLK